ncbi:MAG: hypothetical protein ACKON8_13945, partial [Planctomycetota bacterium]
IYDALETETNTNFRFEQDSLNDLKAAIEGQYKIPVVFDAKALEGFDLAEPTITENLPGIPLRSALRQILSANDLTYVVKNDVLKITTKEAAESDLIVKAYPVGDADELGDQPERFAAAKAEEAKNRIQEGLVFLKSNEFKFAEEEWAKASALDPESGDADFYLGLLNWKQGERISALRNFQEAAQRDSTRYDACNNAAVAGYYAKRTTQLARDFRNAKDRVVPGAAQFIADNMARVLKEQKLSTEHAKQLREVYREAMRDLDVAPFDPAENVRPGPLFIVPQSWRENATGEMDFENLLKSP